MTLPIEPSNAPVFNQILGAVGVLLVSLIAKYARDMRNSLRIYRDEHDILWEDFNIRHDLPWRRHMGRGRSASPKPNGAAGAH